jgi:hypothetical protein
VVLAILLYLNAVSIFPLGSREEGGREYERWYGGSWEEESGISRRDELLCGEMEWEKKVGKYRRRLESTEGD